MPLDYSAYAIVYGFDLLPKQILNVVIPSKPFGATKNEAKNYLFDGFSLFAVTGRNCHFTREFERKIPQTTPIPPRS